MRIIAGKYKGKKLASFEGDAVRPTSDRAKEAVFSVLQFELQGKSFYDAFCGSGSMGIEAISRGAKSVLFSDKSIQSCKLTQKNLDSIGERAKVLNSDCITFLERTSERFDIIFLDPPYKSKDGIKALEIIGKRNLLNDNGIVIYESGSAFNQPIEGLFLEKSKKYGISEFAFYRKLNCSVAVFAGSFDPVTKGHIHIVEKALESYSKVIVAMGINASKSHTFDKFTRLNALNAAFEKYENVTVDSFDGYLVDFLKQNRTANNVRGIRNEEDMRYEEQMLDFNKKLYPEIKNVYINCSKDMQSVSSTAFKALINQPERWNEYLTEEVIKVLLKAL